jgi:hypothetical protein
MGRWIDWRVSEDLTAAEVEAMAAIVDGPLRETLPLVAKQLRDSRPTPPNLMSRLSFHYMDRATAEYASDPNSMVVTDTAVKVAGSVDGRDLNFTVVAGDYSGHTTGFQDYVSIGVLAAASQVSGKVRLTGGDSIDRAYVDHLLKRVVDAGLSIKPQDDFASYLTVDEDA